MAIVTLGWNDPLPLPVLEPDGSWQIVYIPQLSAEGLEFLKRQLDTFQPAIVHKSRHRFGDGAGI